MRTSRCTQQPPAFEAVHVFKNSVVRLAAGVLVLRLWVSFRDKHQHAQQVQAADFHEVHTADAANLLAQIHRGCVVSVQRTLTLFLGAGAARQGWRYRLGWCFWNVEPGRGGHGFERRLDLLVALLELALVKLPSFNVLPQRAG
ncbi:MAG: hypothetical protein HXY24_17990 [Rubrivivax sp.]|nr:hypothetical protein [Rubrivivax sp.]